MCKYYWTRSILEPETKLGSQPSIPDEMINNEVTKELWTKSGRMVKTPGQHMTDL